jgi:hypothetical protein
MDDNAGYRQSCQQEPENSEVYIMSDDQWDIFDCPTKSVPKRMNIAHLSRDGWVAVRFGDRLELIVSDYHERMVAAGLIPLAARINRQRRPLGGYYELPNLRSGGARHHSANF